MIVTDLKDRKGFEVLHNSTAWRIAVHAYEPKVNGIESFQNWGRHMDSQEGFLLLQGKGYLAIADDDKKWSVTELKKDEIQIVEAGERHAVLLEEGAAALIVENQDMSNSITEAMGEETVSEILSKIAEK